MRGSVVMSMRVHYLIVLFILGNGIPSTMATDRNAPDGMPLSEHGRFVRSTDLDLRPLSVALKMGTGSITPKTANVAGLAFNGITRGILETVGVVITQLRGDVQRNDAFDNEKKQKLWQSKIETAVRQTQEYQTNLAEILSVIRRTTNQIESRVADLHGTMENILFRVIKEEIRKMSVKLAMQIVNLREESKESFQHINASMKDIQSMVNQTDNSLQEFRFEFSDQFEMLREEMQENNDYFIRFLDDHFDHFKWVTKENIQRAAQNISSKIDGLENKMNEGFKSVNASIFQSQGIILDHLDSIRRDLSERLDRIDVRLEDIGIQLNLFHDTMNIRFDQLQQAIQKIELKLDQEELNGYIDDMKALIGRWKEMIESRNEQDTEMAEHKKEKFKELCEEAKPGAVIEWIERNIYNQIRHPVTSVPSEYFVQWQKGVLTLRNNAFLMYASCLATDEDKSQNLTVRLINEKKMDLFDDNFLQEAIAVEHVHYAQWWRTYFKKSNLVFHFESGIRDEIERNLNVHEEWIEWSIGSQPNLMLFRIESSVNDTVSVEQVVDQIHSKQPAEHQNDFLFCCLAHTNACVMRSESTWYHVCLGRSVWIHKQADQSSLVVNWWPKGMQESVAQIDNFFVHHQGTGFGVPDTSEIANAWKANKYFIEYMATEPGANAGRFKRSASTWTWTVLLTDNVCWWSQKNNSQCSRNQCNWQNNTAITGSVIKIFSGVDNSKCCDLCAANKGCVAASWYQSMCSLYSSYSNTKQQQNWMAATKLKDCTQCTDTQTGCHRPSIIHDYKIQDSNSEKISNISNERCYLECFKKESRYVAYSWKWTDTLCELHTSHGTIMRQYGSFIILKPERHIGCQPAKENACVRAPTEASPRCPRDLCADSGDGVTYSCYCSLASKVQYPWMHCRTHRRCGTFSECANGGTCVDDPTMPNCVCPPGFVGPTCAYENLCADQPCNNGGTCLLNYTYNVTLNDYTLGVKCECTPGYAGNSCEMDLGKIRSALYANMQEIARHIVSANEEEAINISHIEDAFRIKPSPPSP